MHTSVNQFLWEKFVFRVNISLKPGNPSYEVEKPCTHLVPWCIHPFSHSVIQPYCYIQGHYRCQSSCVFVQPEGTLYSVINNKRLCPSMKNIITIQVFNHLTEAECEAASKKQIFRAKYTLAGFFDIFIIRFVIEPQEQGRCNTYHYIIIYLLMNSWVIHP